MPAEDKLMIEQPDKPHFIELTPQNINPEQLDQLMSVYARSYNKRWIGHDRFNNENLPNTTTIGLLIVNGQIAAAANLNRDRIIIIGVDPVFQGQGFSIELFRHITEFHPNVWISVGADAREMLAVVTSSQLNFRLVENQQGIEGLYRAIKGVPADFVVSTTIVSHPYLSERLAEKDIRQDQFVAFTRPGSLHDASYRQFIFQNLPMVAQEVTP